MKKVAIEVSQQQLFNIYNRITRMYPDRFELVTWSIQRNTLKQVYESLGVDRWILHESFDASILYDTFETNEEVASHRFVVVGNEARTDFPLGHEILFTGNARPAFRSLGIVNPIDPSSIKVQEKNEKFVCDAIAFTNNLRQETLPSDVLSSAVSEGTKLFGNVKVNHHNYLGDINSYEAGCLVSSTKICIDLTGSECLFYFLSGAKRILVFGVNFHTAEDLKKILSNPDSFFDTSEYRQWYSDYSEQVEKNSYDALIRAALNFLEY